MNISWKCEKEPTCCFCCDVCKNYGSCNFAGRHAVKANIKAEQHFKATTTEDPEWEDESTRPQTKIINKSNTKTNKV